jgi:hypothetical protein
MYTLITHPSEPNSSIALIFLHDENHLEIIALFPLEQLGTAEFIVDFLNKEKNGITLDTRHYIHD